MKTPLWIPSKERVEQSHLHEYMQFVNKKYGKSFGNYDELYNWSVTEIESFWDSLWQYFSIITSDSYTKVVDDLSKFPGAAWYPGAKMNYAENMLRHSEVEGPLLVFRGEDKVRKEYTYEEVYQQVTHLATALRREGVKPGDRVVGYLPNLPETIIAMLATSAVGGVWSSCATDIGHLAATDRLGQVDPKVLITADGYYYKGKAFATTENVAHIAKAIPTLQKIVFVHYAGQGVPEGIPNAVSWDEYLEGEVPTPFVFEQLPASHPQVIMFSSGTTGKPKCMVQSQGGLLVNQLKELVLHSDIGIGARHLYITTCSWMMWNWMAATIGTGASLVLYDGNPAYPDTAAIWRVLEEEQVTHFGTSASYLHALLAEGFSPKAHCDLSKITWVGQTGSALSDAGFAFIYSDIGEDIHFSSLSGGTDINGCFAIGNPLCPVYSGELQKAGLGMHIACYNQEGKHVFDEQGELVCETPMPSMPIYFWKDEDGQRYHNAYFDVYSGVWRHGDYILYHGDTKGITFYGRSDSVLKPSGVRIGTAEIYNQVEALPEVVDSLAIGQNIHDDQRVLLFVKLQEGMKLDDELRHKICTTLRNNASPRHVPSLIFQVADIPMTQSGKKVESAVTNMVNGRAVTNRSALANPESLDFFEALLPELEK